MVNITFRAGSAAPSSQPCRRNIRLLGVLTSLLMLLTASLPLRADVETLLSQSKIIEGEPFQLILRVDSAAGGHPNLEPLGADFRIARRSASTNLAIVGGRTSRSTTVTLELIPLRSGTLTLPAIEFPNGERSAAMPIEVLPPQPVLDDGLPDLIVELEADTETAYVQQQVRVTMRLLRRVEIGQNAVLNEPVTSGSVMMKRLGEDDRRYRERREGERYVVHEREYVIFPQESGTIEIGPAVFEGEVITGARSMANPFAPPVTFEAVPSNILTLNVKPIPPEFSGPVWLPAKRLDLHEEYAPQETALHVGDPVVRTLYLWAEGLTSGQLPEFALAPGDGVTIYPEPVQTNDQESKEGFASVRQQDFTLIANRPGEWSLPEIAVPWWNIETDRQEVARLPARTYKALPARGSVVPPTHDATAADAGTDGAPSGDGRSEDPASGDAAASARTVPDATGAAPRGTRQSPWWLVAIACISTLGWLVTGVMLFGRGRAGAGSARRSGSDAPDGVEDLGSREARKRAVTALETADPHAVQRALLAYGRTLAPHHPPRSLGTLAAWATPDMADAITLLEAALYRPETGTDSGAGLTPTLREALKAGLDKLLPPTTSPNGRMERHAHSGDDARLPAMYPIVGSQGFRS